MPWRAIGGTEWATLRMLRGTDPLGIDNLVFARSDAPLVREFFEREGYAVELYDATAFDRGAVSYARATMALARQFRRAKVRVVHGADLAAGFVAALAARTALLPMVCHVRNPYPWLTPYERVWTAALAQRLVFVSEDARRSFGSAAKGGRQIAARKGVVIYDGVMLPATAGDTKSEAAVAVRREFGWGASDRVIGMVARLAQQKDHLTLLRAAERVVAECPDARFLFIGGCGPEKQELAHGERVKAAIAASPARDHVVYAGFRGDVPRYTAAFDIGALSTHFEGFGLVLLEAMALGKPIVATAVGGVPEVVVDGHTGLLHSAGDADRLAEHIVALLRDPARAATMGAAGRQRVATSFSPAETAREIVGVYRAVT
ncbi:glycosyltransferase [Schlegelella sp. ID0723]|uniref:Glycosyltransferase n=2 Tax=Piscinibacter koreensis TaxID=2742824 RepID=A0A7Y6NL08_9BURK|nr:glycosyltransferase [Schlegelella koreensis]NUZ05158.1 glycosyltransferase [Schlegelella koreensis]